MLRMIGDAPRPTAKDPVRASSARCVSPPSSLTFGFSRRQNAAAGLCRATCWPMPQSRLFDEMLAANRPLLASVAQLREVGGSTPAFTRRFIVVVERADPFVNSAP
jgi:hypothetical protein